MAAYDYWLHELPFKSGCNGKHKLIASSSGPIGGFCSQCGMYLSEVRDEQAALLPLIRARRKEEEDRYVAWQAEQGAKKAALKGFKVKTQ